MMVARSWTSTKHINKKPTTDSHHLKQVAKKEAVKEIDYDDAEDLSAADYSYDYYGQDVDTDDALEEIVEEGDASETEEYTALDADEIDYSEEDYKEEEFVDNYESEDITNSEEEEGYYEEETVDDNTMKTTTLPIDEAALSAFLVQFQTAYEKLLTFKDDDDFHQYGFASPGTYNDWMMEAQTLKDHPISTQLLSKGFTTNELVLLGIQYLESKGEENELIKMYQDNFKQVLNEVSEGN